MTLCPSDTGAIFERFDNFETANLSATVMKRKLLRVRGRMSSRSTGRALERLEYREVFVKMGHDDVSVQHVGTQK